MVLLEVLLGKKICLRRYVFFKSCEKWRWCGSVWLLKDQNKSLALPGSIIEENDSEIYGLKEE